MAKEPNSTGNAGILVVLLGLIGLGSLANGLWMLATPLVWYNRIPAGVPDYGPYNEHFVRDVGCAYTTAGLALAWAVYSGSARPWLVAAAAFFYDLHALVHIFDTTRAAVAPEHWLMDLPTTYLPAVILTIIALKLRRSERVWLGQSAS